MRTWEQSRTWFWENKEDLNCGGETSASKLLAKENQEVSSRRGGLPSGPAGSGKGQMCKQRSLPSPHEMTDVWMSIFCLWHRTSSRFMRKDRTFCLTLYNIPTSHLPTSSKKLKPIGKDCYELGHEQVVVLCSPLVLCKMSLSPAISQLLLSVSARVCLLSSLRTSILMYLPTHLFLLKREHPFYG